MHRITAIDDKGDKELIYQFPVDGGSAPPSGMNINEKTGVLSWHVPADYSGSNEFCVEIEVVDQYGMSATQELELNVGDEDVIAPSISMFVRDADGNVYMPGDELDVTGTYSIFIDLNDNLHSVDQPNPPICSLKAEDVAVDEAGEYYHDETINNEETINFVYGQNKIPFSELGLNPGYIHFTVTVQDAAGNETVSEQSYYVADTSVDAPAKLLEFGSEDFTGAGIMQITEQGEIDFNAYYQNHSEYTYKLKLESMEDSSDYVLLAEGATFSGEHTCQLDPALYESGFYRLVLTIRCACGEDHIIAIDERIIEIYNDGGTGNLDLSFTDLQVQLGGIPVSLVRNYDSSSLYKNTSFGESHFGPGWTLNYLQAEVKLAHENQVTDSLQDPIAEGTRLLITLPDGTIERFTFAPSGLTGQEDRTFIPHFVPDEDNQCTLEVWGQEESLLLVPLSSNQRSTFLVANTNAPYIPANLSDSLVLRTRAGLEYHYDTQTGKLKAIEDDKGNRIEITRSKFNDNTQIRISSGNDHDIVIELDDSGNVTCIRDPKNQTITYTYNATTGKLEKVIQRDAVETTYTYTNDDFPYHLTGIIDDAGVQVLSAEYDDEGILSSLTDAGDYESTLDVTIRLSGGRKVTRVDNGNGITIAEVRDSRGNLLGTFQSLNTTGSQYLANVYDYNMRGLLMGESMPFIVVEGENFDSADDPSSGTILYDVTPVDSNAWKRRFVYDKQGRMKCSIDVNGNETIYQYDDYDRLITTIHPSGATDHSIYHPRTGGLLESYSTDGKSGVKWNHTRYEYSYGRLTKTFRVESDGQETLISSTDYDVYGRVKSTTDAADVTTYYGYDNNGNQTHSWYHWVDEDQDKTLVVVSKTNYDDTDRVTGSEQYELTLASTTDRITDHTNLTDSLVDVSPQWTTFTNYNSRGLVESTVDRFETETYNKYDVRGNLVETATQANNDEGQTGWLVSRTVYDSQGRVEFVSDELFVAGTTIPTDITNFGTRTVYDEFDRVQASIRYENIKVTSSAPTSSGCYTMSLVNDSGAEWDWDDDDNGAKKLSSSETYYDDFGRVDYIKDEYQAVTKYTYDLTGRQIQSQYHSKTADGSLCLGGDSDGLRQTRTPGPDDRSVCGRRCRSRLDGGLDRLDVRLVRRHGNTDDLRRSGKRRKNRTTQRTQDRSGRHRWGL